MIPFRSVSKDTDLNGARGMGEDSFLCICFYVMKFYEIRKINGLYKFVTRGVTMALLI